MASSSEWPSASNRLRILAGGMEAGLAGPPDVEWSPGGDPVDDLRRWLATRGVKAGIDDKALGELAASLQAGIPIRWPVYVARGIPPRGATPGGIFVDLAPGILVRRGQEIGKVIAAGPPQPGKRVTGEEIAPPTKPQAPHRAGEGIQVDAAVCRSAVDGYLVKREDRFEVLSLLKEAVDRMSVEVILRPVREGSLRPSRALLEEIASERKYVGSIDWLAVEKALAVPVPAGTESRSVPLLVGDPGAAGKPGRTDLVIGAALAIGEEDDGGQVDYRQRSAVKSVRQGDLLARRVLPTPGTPATDIFGKAHPLPAPADAMLEPGRNVAVRGGGLEMYATAAGCVIVGKTNTHEFAYGATTPPTRNPLDPDRIAGGSSGGSAAAIASGSACLAVGTDTGGSVRLPAALCGVAGFRPRRNAIGTEGVIPLAPEFDQWGLLAASAEVLELAWSALSGRPAPGPHVVPQLVAPASLVTTLPAVEHSVAAAFEAALAASGLDVIRERMPSLSEWLAPRMAIQMEQALATHRRAGWWPSLRDRYSAEVRRNLKIAEAQTADLHAARARLRELDAEIDRLLRGGAVIATPTVPIKAPLVSEVEAMPQRADARHPIVSILASATLPFSRSDLASLTVPVWHGSHPLPASVQMVAQDESLVFAAARRMPRRLGS